VVVRDAERRDIRTEQVRELSRWLALQPLMGARKIAILDGAEHLNEHGQNALLKTLEEPPGRSVLLLIASASAGLLPTVRSRCQILRLQPLDREAVRRVLAAAGLPPERAERLAPLAEGCPGRALALEGEEVAKAREVILGAVPRLDRFGAVELSALAQELARGPVEAALRALLAWYRDALETALLGDQARVRNADALAALRAAAVRLPAQARLRQLEAVCDTIEALGRNANRMLALETMLLTLREIERGSAKATAG
jgi:DNA polymerase-3 subunit delta'